MPPYYHVHVTKKSGHPLDVYELDFAEENLIKDIVEPYKKGKNFMCGGTPLDPFDIAKMHISKTDKPSSELIPQIKKEIAESRSYAFISDEYYVVEKGENVTRKFITSPPTREPSQESKPYEKGSLAELVVRGFEKIKQLSESQQISQKLQSFDMLLFVFIATFIISQVWYNSILNPEQFVLLVVLVISLLFGFISNIIYAPILETVCNFASNKIKSLRVGINFMFVALATAFLGFVFNIFILSASALGLVALHLIIIPLGGPLFSKDILEDKEIKPGQIWGAIGKVADIVGIITFLVMVISYIVSYLH
jgi:hypothetical protein